MFPLSLLAGLAAGGLTVLAGEGAPRRILAALAVTGPAVPVLNRVIDTEYSPGQPPAPMRAEGGKVRGNG